MRAQDGGAVGEFAAFLGDLRVKAGRPSYRQLAAVTGYGRSTIGDAFGGVRCPTWDVARGLIEYLGGDAKDGELRHRAARAGKVTAPREVAWLIDLQDPAQRIEWLGLPSIERELRRVLAPDSGPSSPAADRTGPAAVVQGSWGIVRRVVLNAATTIYGDNIGSWSSDTLVVLDRLVADDKLPRSIRAAANELHRLSVQAGFDSGNPGYVEITWVVAVKHLVLGTSLAAAVAAIPALWDKVQTANQETIDHRRAFEEQVGTGDAIREELLRRVDADQAARANLPTMPPWPDDAVEELHIVDADNTQFAKSLIAAEGWPGTSRIGVNGGHALWLLVQHADDDLDFQESCVPLLAAAVGGGEAEARDLAYLIDRVSMGRGRPQLYGM